MKDRRLPVTLAQVLIVTLIVFLVASVVWPQGSMTMRRRDDLVGLRQVLLGAQMYANDYDETLPGCPVDGPRTESYVFVTKLNPYIKSADVARLPGSPFIMGAAAHQYHDVPAEMGGGYDMTPPDDPCVGLPASRFGHHDFVGSHYFDDVYLPSDLGLNPVLWAYIEGGCPSGGVSDGVAFLGANLQRGVHPSVIKGHYAGVNFLGPADVEFENPGRIVLVTRMPVDSGLWPGAAFWPDTPVLVRKLCPIGYLDGHCQMMSSTEMLGDPPGSSDPRTYPYNHNFVSQQNWNPPKDGHGPPGAGAAFYWWGTNYSDLAHR